MAYSKFIALFIMGSALIFSSCSVYEQSTSALDRVHFPISVAVHPSGKYLYVVNSNFDTRYRQKDGGAVIVFDAETGRPLPKNSMHIPSFGGIVSLNATGTDAYIPTRYLNTVTALHLSETGDKIYCVDNNGNQTNNPEECQINQLADSTVNGEKVKGAQIGMGPYSLAVDTRFRSTTVSGISGSVTLTLDLPNAPFQTFTGDLSSLASQLNALPGIDATVKGSDLVLTPAKSSHLSVIRVLSDPSFKVSYDADDAVFVSSMQANTVATLFFPKQQRKGLQMINTPLASTTGGIAKRPHSNDVLAVERGGRNLVLLQPHFTTNDTIDALFKRLEFPLNNYVEQIFGHGVTFNDTGDYAYIISQFPSALYIVRIIKALAPSVYGNGGVQEQYVVTRTIPLKSQPTSITFYDSPKGPLLFVTCTESKSVLVIDTKVAAITDEIMLGDTPSDFVVNKGACKRDINKCVAYVPLYDDTPNSEDTCSTAAAGQCGSIGVIDLNPFSSNYLHLVRKIQ